MENRRVSDQILIEMSEKIGQIHGTLKAMEKRHDDTMETLKSHDDRLDTLEETKYKAHGFLIGVAGLAGAVGSYASHLLGVFK